MIVIQVIFLLLVGLLILPVAVLALQIVMSLLPYNRPTKAFGVRPSIAVLIPAHNESASMIPTLLSVKEQLTAQDRLIVIADNCSDDTAKIALDNAIEVIERFDNNHRGKGYALNFGVRFLERQAIQPEVVIIIDADCILELNALNILSFATIQRQRPIQALYLMKSPSQASLKIKIAEFAWNVKNWARALGYMRLGLPCQLMGTGMAFPWALIKKANLDSGHIVEDLKLGIDFAEDQQAPCFCPEAQVNSSFPINKDGLESQRTRWEHGHLGMIVKEGPKMLWKSICEINIGMLALVLDMCVPPLALLAIFVIAIAMFGAVAVFATGQVMPWMLAFLPLFLFGVSVIMAWQKFGRHILSLGNLAYAPIYILLKIPLYLKFIVKRQVSWVRSKRD